VAKLTINAYGQRGFGELLSIPNSIISPKLSLKMGLTLRSSALRRSRDYAIASAELIAAKPFATDVKLGMFKDQIGYLNFGINH
jgi:hypothetical protein